MPPSTILPLCQQIWLQDVGADGPWGSAHARTAGSELASRAGRSAARRLGSSAVERLLDSILPIVSVVAVENGLHDAALGDRQAGSGRVSFVDRTSLAFMRGQRIDGALAFDADFESAEFDLAT